MIQYKNLRAINQPRETSAALLHPNHNHTHGATATATVCLDDRSRAHTAQSCAIVATNTLRYSPKCSMLHVMPNIINITDLS
jgi:hypothetical protein